MTNIQDYVMIHVGFDYPARIGAFCSITHRATIHGATVGDHCLIGIGATLMDGAEIGAGSIVAGHAIVGEGAIFPPHSVVAGIPAKQIGERDSARANRLNAWIYHRNSRFYAAGAHRAWDGADFRDWRASLVDLIEKDEDLTREAELRSALRVPERP